MSFMISAISPSLVQYILVLVTSIVFAIIELVLVHTIARCATDTALSFFKTDQTDEMHEVVQDLCLEVEASQLRTTLLDLDVGEPRWNPALRACSN
jgi:hypothetical protein